MSTKGAIINSDGSSTGIYKISVVNADGSSTRIYKAAIVNADGSSTKIYQSYDAQVHNINSAVAGINEDGSIYITTSSTSAGFIEIPVAIITLPINVSLVNAQLCGNVKSVSANILVNGGSGQRYITVNLYNDSFTTNLAQGYLNNPDRETNPFTGDISIQAQASGNYQQFGLSMTIAGGSGAAISNYSASVPAGGFTLSGINLKEIELI